MTHGSKIGCCENGSDVGKGARRLQSSRDDQTPNGHDGGCTHSNTRYAHAEKHESLWENISQAYITSDR